MQVPSYCYWPIGELAASAPILQFEDIVPLETFYDIVSSDIKRESSTCFNYIKQPLNKTDDLWNWLVSANSFLAMVDYPYPANFMMPLPGHPIKENIGGSGDSRGETNGTLSQELTNPFSSFHSILSKKAPDCLYISPRLIYI
ncbi:hypothetical protein Ahy_A05g022041 isoform J [Arachis hypogaea]|uniref:Uncharacterized protein n=1 Tax=Arachis hypogaea TaxID=3818 RepID=A0A445CZF1_ARAHY|nr:hypothetical protein Ahy_A05g022041 isoform J [Arachis hypogaea]